MYIESFSALFSMMTNEQMNLYSSEKKKIKKDRRISKKMKEVCYNKVLYNYIESTLIRNKIVADEDSFPNLFHRTEQ